jgi:ABC-2 type transport system permease protein
MRRGIFHYFHLVRVFIRVSIQKELAYRSNFLVGVLYSVLNFGTGMLGLIVIFSQVEDVRGWSFSSTLAVLGVYLLMGAVRDLFMGPSLDALTGMDGEVWLGTFDFTLVRPVNTQFMASVRHWRPLVMLDVVLALGVLGYAMGQLGSSLSLLKLGTFLLTLLSGGFALYAILLGFSGMVFISPGFLFSWVFNGIFQMARYPVGLYPGVLRFVMTWIIPVGVITTIPAKALTGDLSVEMLAASLIFTGVLVVVASKLFRRGIRKYASASS